MKFSVTHRIEENVELPGGVIDILSFAVKFDNGNTLDFKYEFLHPNVDYIAGNFSGRRYSSYSQNRKKKLNKKDDDDDKDGNNEGGSGKKNNKEIKNKYVGTKGKDGLQ